MLQDAALVGVRRAHWVPIENSLFGLAKIALLVLLSAAMPVYGPFVAFTAPALPIVVGLNLWLFHRLRQERADATGPLTVGSVARFAGGEWVSWVALLVHRQHPAAAGLGPGRPRGHRLLLPGLADRLRPAAGRQRHGFVAPG